ncbi:hypothetical protein Patl1_34306 [Pistacia atlantica]|uniref:Uncharacterized protein n=1 Tax=Pistacia atlantica TaxID=434234 RepID=A0ACC0ZVV9_9ROSI|nr:hypothetical protein Patl1_34306 [Pistacia atlantica]
MTWLILAPNLTSIAVYNCSDMEEIINAAKFGEVEEIMGNLNPFAEVRNLVLQILPKMKSIHRNALSFPLLTATSICGCPQLKKLPLYSGCTNEHKFVIAGEEHWWEELEWEHQSTQYVFRPY